MDCTLAPPIRQQKINSADGTQRCALVFICIQDSVITDVGSVSVIISYSEATEL
jgi:hypothetical protein